MESAGRKPRLLHKLNVEYLKAQIETGNPRRAKRALQDVCKHYRNGLRVAPDQLPGFEQSIVGLIYTQRGDEKVRRWALNAVARLGREETCIEAVIQALRDFSHEPQTLAAGIAATYRISRNASRILKALDFDPKMEALAALQHVPASSLDLSALPLNVDGASPEMLKLALVVIGLNRAPENMLNPKHTNEKMVAALGGHHDRIVVQYSIWAITENRALGVSSLGVDIRDALSQPPNVRSWIYHLLAMSPEAETKFLEHISAARFDPDAEARGGLAVGLRESYFADLDQLVLDWFFVEADLDVRHQLVDHMILQSHRSQNYEQLVLELYEKEPSESGFRRTMESVAAGLPIYAGMKQIEAGGRPGTDLFRGAMFVTNNNFNIGGNIQGGAVTLGGGIDNRGQISASFDSRVLEVVHSELSKLEGHIHGSTLDADVKRTTLSAIADAKVRPGLETLNRAMSAVAAVAKFTKQAAEITASISAIASTVSSLS